MSRRARGRPFREAAAPGSAPLSVPEDPPRFPDPPVRRTGNTAERPISAHPPSRKGGKVGRKAGGTVGPAKDGDGSAHRRPGRWRREGGAGLVTPPQNATATAGSPMPQRLAARGGPPHLGESISPSKVPPNWHSIGLGADGEPRGTGLPRFSNRGKRRWRPRRRAAKGGNRRREVPSVL